MWNKTSIISRQADVHQQQVNESIVILNPSEGKSHELNETGMYLWRQLEKEQTYTTLLENLCSEYDVSNEQATQDISDFIDTMLDQKLINISQ